MSLTEIAPGVFTSGRLLNASESAREWRDRELFKTDYFVSITDHPDRTAILAYRVLLRDWPSTSAFPAVKPTM